MKCPDCGNKITKDDAFCPECGSKIDFEKIEKKEKKKKHEKQKEKTKHETHTKEIKVSKKNMIVVSVIVALLIIASVVIFAVPMPYEATQQYSERVPYDAQESYTEKEPYSATKTYYESESYQDQECETRYPQYNREIDSDCSGSGCDIICMVSNFEDEAITVSYRITADQSEGYDKDNADYSYGFYSWTIGPGQTATKTRNWDFVGQKWYNCEIRPQTMQDCQTVTKFRDVPKTRTVTKYRDETKYRTVTKYKDESKERKITKYDTLFNQWTGKAKYYLKE